MSYTQINGSNSRGPNDKVGVAISVTFNEGATEDEVINGIVEAYDQARDKADQIFRKREKDAKKAAQKPAEPRKGLSLDDLLTDIFGPAEGLVDSIFGSIARALEEPGNCPQCKGTFTVSSLGLCSECESWR